MKRGDKKARNSSSNMLIENRNFWCYSGGATLVFEVEMLETKSSSIEMKNFSIKEAPQVWLVANKENLWFR